MACRLTGVDEENEKEGRNTERGAERFRLGSCCAEELRVSPELRVRSAGCSVSQRVGKVRIERTFACRITEVPHHYWWREVASRITLVIALNGDCPTGGRLSHEVCF